MPRSRLYASLLSLVEKSLARHSVAADGEERFWMLATMREYASEQLARHGETERLRERHAAYYAALAHVSVPTLMGNSSQVHLLSRFDRDHNNLRAALDWSIELSPDDEQGLRLADDLFLFWNPRSDYSEGRHYLRAAAGRATAPTTLRARALNRTGVFAQWQGDADEAVQLQQQALAIQETLGDKVGISRTLQVLGMNAGMKGDFVQAGSLFERSLVLEREIGNNIPISTVLNNLALVAQNLGDYAKAETLLEESLVLKRALGGEMGIATSLHGLATVRRRLGRTDDALALLQESLVMRRNLGDKQGMASSLEHIAFVAVERGQNRIAAELFGYAAAQREMIGYALSSDDRPDYDAYVARARAALGVAAYDGAFVEGRAVSLAMVTDRVAKM